MDTLLSSLNILETTVTNKQGDENLVQDIEKLKRLIDILVDVTGDFILEVYADPINIINTKFEKLHTINIQIIYNRQYQEELHNKKKECKELIHSLFEDEFSENIKQPKVRFTDKYDLSNCPLLIYTRFNQFKVEEIIDDERFSVVKKLVQSGKYEVSLPYSYDMSFLNTIIVHCDDLAVTVELDNVSKSEQLYGATFTRVNGSSNITPRDYYYIGYIGRKDVEYELPYVRVTLNDVNQEMRNN